MKKKDILEKISEDYKVEYDYDSINTKLAFENFKEDIINKDILEVGCADGYMTKMLLNYCKNLDVMEPSENYCKILKKQNIKVRKIYNCFIEKFNKSLKYDAIILAGVLHHIENPLTFLKQLKNNLKDNGFILATVPNVESLHRQIGVEMGILKNVFDATDRNLKFNQYGRFNLNLFEELFISSEYSIIESYGYMIKPFSSNIMETLKLNETQIRAMNKIGMKYPNICSQLYVKVKKND